MKTVVHHGTQAGFKSAVIYIAALFAATCVFAQGTAFTYQGQLDDSGTSTDGSYDMEFKVYDALSVGAQVGGTVTSLAVPVDGGLFAVELDFGSSVFTGADRWLEIGVQTNGGGGFTTLSPRAKFTSAPYAVKASTAQVADSVPNSSIGSAQVANNSLTSSDLGPNSVGTSEVIDNNLTANDLAASSVGASEIATGAVASPEVLDNSLTANDLAANSVTASEIAAGAVGSSEVANGSLTTTDLNLASVDARYVEVAGDAMTGKLSISSSVAVLDLEGTSNPMVQFYGGATRKAFIQSFSDDLILANDVGGNVILWADSKHVLVADGAGRVGVNRSPVSATLEVQGANTADTSDAMVVYNSASTDLLHVENSGQVSVGYASPSAKLWVEGNGTEDILRVRDSGSTKLYINGDGQVAINGLTFATGYALSVDGKIACEEVLVQVSGSWPDYVFADDYNLRPLAEVEAHITANKRLPGIPAAETVSEEGISVGQMQKRMMEKIEELTLYTIAQEKRIAELEVRLAE